MGDIGKGLRNIIEKIAYHIPGYAGYQKRERRRETDHLYRMYLVEKMREIKRIFDEVSNQITNMGNLDLLKPVDRIYKKLEKVTDKIRFAGHGYKGFFDVVSVDFPELEKLYNFDLSLNEDIGAIKEKVDMLAKALDSDTLLPHLEGFMKSIDEFNEKMVSRDEVITAVSGGK
ncbi:hypothetical protein KAU13_02395 [candidate division WOR-3 bacterium]|nr:hypothetical protein [candidate division WOR-3 bacterium]TET76913.1 MAG: hypothetical protein E3J41_08345 [Candidatus Cloacimonadota bacterium]